jgi:hypothetical protein
VSVPLEVKSTDDEVPTLTLPEAVTLDCTVPRATVAVRCTAVPDEDVPRNPYTELTANRAAAAATSPRAPIRIAERRARELEENRMSAAKSGRISRH